MPSIALIGPLADSALDMLGSWPADGRMSDVVTLRTALQDRFKDGKTKVLYAKGTSILSDSDAGFAEAVAAARQASVVILALGESAATMTGESSSLTRLDLPGNQEDTSGNHHGPGKTDGACLVRWTSTGPQMGGGPCARDS